MSWASVAGAAIGVVGGAMTKGSSSSSSQNQIDPSLQPYLYGPGGLIGNVNNLYQQQNAQGGLNPLQTAGLEMQRQTLMNPAYTQGFDQMRSLGSSLLGGGVAGNPFGNTMGPQQTTMPPMPQGSLGLPSAATQPIQQQQAAPMDPQSLQNMINQMLAKYGTPGPAPNDGGSVGGG